MAAASVLEEMKWLTCSLKAFVRRISGQIMQVSATVIFQKVMLLFDIIKKLI